MAGLGRWVGCWEGDSRGIRIGTGCLHSMGSGVISGIEVDAGVVQCEMCIQNGIGR